MSRKNLFFGALASCCLVALALLVLAPGAGAVEYGRYDFTYYYNNGNGDRYDGYFFGPDTLGLTVGSQKTIASDENTQAGYYRITDFINLHSNSTDNKNVFVTSYYDLEGNKYYLPLNYDEPMGTNYWGSETGFIYQNTDIAYRFGTYNAVFYEADGETGGQYNGFTFKHTYANGDYYTGHVYTPADYYSVGLTWYKADESGDYGKFEILGLTSGSYDAARNGQVWVENYYNARK